jgi:hypothetical protein
VIKSDNSIYAVQIIKEWFIYKSKI